MSSGEARAVAVDRNGLHQRVDLQSGGEAELLGGLAGDPGPQRDAAHVAVTHAASVTSVSRLGSIALFVILGVRIGRSGPMRILALINLALITVAFFGDELLDPIGVPGIWFPFGIGVSRTQYLYAILIPLQPT